MGLNRRFRLTFSQEIITDDNREYIVKEKPIISVQIVETEHLFQETSVSEKVIIETILNRLYEGVKAELRNPHVFESKLKQSKPN